ncbi:hypothetical protein FJZ36_15485 [Candidatus Poribacteria bacterium]|nr:hypothetical protein [Candidatus Poribacteria bacterium]
MRKLTRLLPPTSLAWFITSAIVFGSIGLVGCGSSPFSSLGPQEPLLPAIEGQAKFSDRFQLEEIPQFFYDLFGKELLEGNEVHQYVERKEFNEKGDLVQGWSGQLDSNRFVLQLDRQILTEDTFRGRHSEAAIGDHLRIKPETLFPAGYIMRKTEFDGHRFDLSFSHERHLFSLLNSRISNTIYIPQAGGGGTLAPTFGRRTSTEGGDFLENARMIGFRAQGLIGDIFRVGFTYVNLHREFHQRIDNPFLGTVANTPPAVLTMTFRDDSPEDGRVGAAFKTMKVVIKYQERKYEVETITEDPKTGEPLEEPLIIRRPLPTQEQKLELVVTVADMKDGALAGPVLEAPEPDTTVTKEMPDPRIKPVDGRDDGYPSFGAWRVANGFDAFHWILDLRSLPGGGTLNPSVVKSIELTDIEVAGDYNIVVRGYSVDNVGDEAGPWIKSETGLIEMPYRDVIQREGNIGQEDYDAKSMAANPDNWDPITLGSYKYGAGRGAALYGVDLEGTVGNVLIRAQYSINAKYKQFPTIPQDKIDYTLLASDPGLQDPAGADFLADKVSEGRTFAANDGEAFRADFAGSENDSADIAWFVYLKHRFRNILFEEAFYRVDPGYTTNYVNFGANTDRDEEYNVERTPASQDQAPWDEGVYSLVEDDDDNDDWPDDNDFDGVLPQADDRDLNGILDFQEDFLIFDADPPVFDDLSDLNNNSVIDSLEDDFEPDYEYGIDRKGYHVKAGWDILDNMTLLFGWLNETEVSSARRNDSKYLHFHFQRDIAEFGTFNLQNRFRAVTDDIPDYAITLRVGQLDIEEIPDKLDFFNAKENTTTLQFLYNAIPNLTLELKYLLSLGKQNPPDEERAIVLDDPETENIYERIDLMVPINQVDASGGRRSYPFYPDPNLLFDVGNWEARAYGVRTYTDADGNFHVIDGKDVRQQLAILKARYEIPFTRLPGVGTFVRKVGEDMVLTPLYKYIVERYNDRDNEELPVFDIAPFEGETRMALDPLKIQPGDAESLEYLRFNRNTRETVEGARFDYQFSQRVKLLAGFQYRKFVNKDTDYFRYLTALGEDGFANAPILYRPSSRTRIFELQIIQQGLWAGFNVVVLSGFRIRKDVLRNVSSNTTFVRAMVGF